jgi:hypothetical protein
LKVAAVIRDDLSQSWIEGCRIVVPGCRMSEK